MQTITDFTQTQEFRDLLNLQSEAMNSGWTDKIHSQMVRLEFELAWRFKKDWVDIYQEEIRTLI